MALEQSTTFWSDFQSEFSLDHELPMSEDAGWTVAEQPIIVACASCSLPVLASAFARHWGDCNGVPMEEEPSPSPPEFVVSARSTPVPNDITAPSRTTAASTVKTSKKGFQMAPTLGGSSQGGAGTLGPNPAIVIPAKTSSKKKGGAAADAATAASKKKGVGSIKSKKVIDLDRHCGVKLDSGEVCSRSLKCKIHTVGMKRAVRGRSQNFDVLYADWTRKGATKEDPLFDALSPDDEVNTILTSLRLYKPMPLASRITPSIASWNRAKARLILTEALRQNA